MTYIDQAQLIAKLLGKTPDEVLKAAMEGYIEFLKKELTFRCYAPISLPNDLGKEFKELRGISVKVTLDNRIAAIKAVRECLGWTFSSAKSAIDSAMNGGFTFHVFHGAQSKSQEHDIQSLNDALVALGCTVTELR
jgi:ribosomal protein L7/L12